MNNYGLKVSKSGFDVKTCAYKDLEFSSQFDTLKVAYTGTITLSLPAETFSTPSVVRTASYTHNLGYIPAVFPACYQVLNTDIVSGTNDFIINNEGLIPIPPGAYGPPFWGERANLYATSTEIILEVERYNGIGFDIAYGAKNAIAYVTVFYNQIDETFNFL